MTHVRRALGTMAVSAVVAVGPTMVATPTAHAQAPQPASAPTVARQLALLDLVPLQLPLLSGLAGVGSLLSVTQPVWNLPGVSTTIVWLRDGVPIPGTQNVWSYLPTEADAGADISALVTGSLLGLLPVSLITNALGIPLPGLPGAETPPSATTPVVATGTGKVGTDLVATPPVWDPIADATTYQWLRAGTPIAGATSTTYRMVPDDVGKAITVRATGTKGSASGTSTSAPKLGVLGDAPTATAPPSLTGAPKVGSTLTATPGTWTGTGPLAFSYQWYRGTTPIPGASVSSYVVKAADAGQKLAAIVTATRAGFAPGLAATQQVTVAKATKAASTTTIALVKKSVPRTARGSLRVTLRGGVTKPAGSVTVYDGKRRLKAYVIRASDNGTRVVRLPRLAPGRHRLTAVFAGSASHSASRSAAVTLTVRK